MKSLAVSPDKQRILITGATGFIGQRMMETLQRNSRFDVEGICRKNKFSVDHRIHEVDLTATTKIAELLESQSVFSDLGSNSYLLTLLKNIDVVIHCAGKAHTTQNEALESIREYKRVNIDLTLNLARQAAINGVRRFIFISSIGVNGNINTRPFTEDHMPKPEGFYAQSKWEAEQALWEVQRETGIELVIIRPPLVYGPNAPGNFGNLVRLVNKGVPLPLGALNNKRSLIALDNLVDLIITSIGHPAAANQVFLAGDSEDLSTTELLRGVAKAAGVSSRLIPVPASVLIFMASLLGKREMAQRLSGSLQVDISKARDLLGWTPLLSVEEGLRRCFVKNA